MGGLLTVLPLAIVMVAGPQIISAVFLATSVDWARNSVVYVVGGAISISVVVAIAYLVVKGAKSSPGASSEGGEGQALDAVLLALLAFMAVIVYRKRRAAHPPRWMGKLQEAKPSLSFRLGLLLLGVFPANILTSVTVGTRLAREGEPLWHALGFLAVTLLLLAMPAFAVLAMGRRAETVLPKLRDSMHRNSWIVSELVIAIFIVIEVNSLATG